MSFMFPDKLTKNFRLSEFVRSETANQNNINVLSFVDSKIYENLKKTASVLQDCRDYLEKPIYINSGYRPALLNKLVGGVPTSRHIDGLAADVRMNTLTDLRSLYKLLSKHKQVKYLYLKQTKKGHYIHFNL